MIIFAEKMTIKEYNEICDYLREVIKDTSWEGNVYTVGGCCRDAIMGREINDVDLAVTVPDGGVAFAMWLQQEGLTLEPPILYRRFSTSKLHLKAFPEHEIEIVQTRREQYTDANSRNPEVCFGSIMDDCERRDLTINSLYKDVTTGEVLDLTGRGIADIRACRIDTPMDPDETYSDDPIRILRTLRFASRYGWEIPDRVMTAMKRHASRLKIVRRPRIATEFEKIIRSSDPVEILKTMKEIGAIFKVLPEMAHLYRQKDHSREKEMKGEKLPTLWELTMDHLSKAGESAEERFAALFTEFYRVRMPYGDVKARENGKRSRRGQGRSAVITTALKRLMYDADFIKRVKTFLPPIPADYKPSAMSMSSVQRDGSAKYKKKKRRGHRGRRHRPGGKTEATA